MKIWRWRYRCSCRLVTKLIVLLLAVVLFFINVSVYYSHISEPIPSRSVVTVEPRRNKTEIIISIQSVSVSPTLKLILGNDVNYDDIYIQNTAESTRKPRPIEGRSKRPAPAQFTMTEARKVLPGTESPEFVEHEEPNDPFQFRIPNIVHEDPASFYPKKFKPRDKCKTSYPKNEKLRFNNMMWQILRHSNWTMYLFGSYYDNRLANNNGTHQEPVVRVIGIANRIDLGSSPSTTIWCQLWFPDRSTPKLIKATKFKNIWPKHFGNYKNGVKLPLAFSCPLSKKLNLKKSERPFAVSLTLKKCEKGKNKLKVAFKPPAHGRKDFAVCVKGLDFPKRDISVRLIEWIELVRLLGAHKIYFYEFAVDRNTKKVLNYYQRKGQIGVTPLTLPAEYSNDPEVRHQYLIHNILRKRQMELLPYNDCLNLHMYQYKYIVLLDVDEVIVPIKYRTWKELLANHKKGNRSKANKSFYGVKQSGCFLEGVEREWIPDVPKHMHMLQHIYKIPFNGRSISGMKAFFDPTQVEIVFNHWPQSCLGKKCRGTLIQVKEAHLQHYKHYLRHCGVQKRTPNWRNCHKLSCLNHTADRTVWKYRKELIPRVDGVMKELRLQFKAPPAFKPVSRKKDAL